MLNNNQYIKIQSIRLIDFGSAFNGSSYNSKINGIRGTNYYCSPEMTSLNKNITCSADVWSFGIIIYLLLMNYYPFDLNEIAYLKNSDRCYNIVNEKLDLVKKKYPNCDLKYNIIKKVLSINPNDRDTINNISNQIKQL